MVTDIENDIKAQLDALAEFEAQRDHIEYEKAKLLDDVKVPEEVEAIVKDGFKRISEVEKEYIGPRRIIYETYENEMAKIEIPENIKIALAQIDKQRNKLRSTREDDENSLSVNMREHQARLHAEIEAQTKQVYADIAKRKADIEAEFAGSRQAVEENIDRLKELIKANVKQIKQSVRGGLYHAVYVSGRITWNTDKMEAWMIDHPFLAEARKEGEPSVTIRKV